MAGCELLCGLCGFWDFNPGLPSPSTLSFKKLNCFKNYFFFLVNLQVDGDFFVF